MSSLPLRRLVSGIGLVVAVVTTISLPAGYAVINYLAEMDRLKAWASLDASHVARYIYQHGTLWPYHRVRLAEIIERTNIDDGPVVQRIYTSDGSLILEQGHTWGTPTLTRSVPILVSSAQVGRVEVEASARPLLINTALVALLSALLGFFAYFGARVFPLRVLDRTLSQLREREGELRETNGRFEAALANMPHGLCMFDGERRLLLCNERYAALYDLPDPLTQPGTSYLAIMDYRDSRPTAPVDPAALLALFDVSEERPEVTVFDSVLQDGRTIRISHRPRQDGGFVASQEDITEKVRAEAQIAHMAHHDALTGLPNRVLFREQLERALAKVTQRSGVASNEALAVLCLDLDHFKEVNDTLGHPTGDALLQAVAERLRACLGQDDAVARLGGDEFAIVQVGGVQPQNATILAERVIDALTEPFDLVGQHVVIGTSVGIALSPTDSDDPDSLLKAADMALYRAKSDGRTTFRFFEPEMDARMQKRRLLELDLRQALPNGEFEVHYQPMINVAENRVSGFEALLRWTHPVRGRVSPADFIPLAEEIGIIGSLGTWVLRQACLDASQWPSEVRIAVNLSPVQFKSRTLVLDVVTALGRSGLPAHRLELEITETVMLQDTEVTLGTLQQLRELGVRISMDDFGTGYSSLNYLRKFPFDKIKIDQSFIRDLPQDQEATAIVRAIIALAHSLGMSTTAEGIETVEQLETMRAEGCTEVQGWLFSPARPASEVPALLSRPMESRRAA